jgi:hypothetical protein
VQCKEVAQLPVSIKIDCSVSVQAVKKMSKALSSKAFVAPKVPFVLNARSKSGIAYLASIGPPSRLQNDWRENSFPIMSTT